MHSRHEDWVSIPAIDYTPGATAEVLAWLHRDPLQPFPDSWFLDELGARQIHIDAFQISRTPVTVAEFSDFTASTGYTTTAERRGWSLVHDGTYWTRRHEASWRFPDGMTSALDLVPDHPAVHISHSDASAYADWLNARLPTEYEWEAAATGSKPRIWPWGNQWAGKEAVSAEYWNKGPFQDISEWYDWWRGELETSALPRTLPVGTLSPDGDSPFGVADLAGQVYEWTSSTYLPYSRDIDHEHAARQAFGKYLVLRGGSWMNYRYQCRCSERIAADPISYQTFASGFRCARGPTI